MKKKLAAYSVGAALLFVTAGLDSAYALPSFARQTGFKCEVCHTVFPELTQVGRDFKLRGYTMTGGSYTGIPVSAMVMIGYSHAKDTTLDAVPQPKMNDKVFLPQMSVFYGGKITDHIGAFIQVTAEHDDDGNEPVGMDIMDIRYANSTNMAGKELIYGVSINNNPTVSDLWNSTPIWGEPFESSVMAANGILGTALETDDAHPAGATLYGQWNDMVYAEFGFYTDSHGNGLQIFSWTNTATQSGADIKGTVPYGRIALQHTFGNNYIMIGAYGMREQFGAKAGDPYVANTTYSDRAIDAEYQYINDKNIVTATATRIKEVQTGGTIGDITSTNARVGYYYNHKYGASVQYFSVTGTGAYAADPTVTDGSVGDSNGMIYEAYFLPKQNIKLKLQYKDYNKFGGYSANASKYNNYYLLAWMMF